MREGAIIGGRYRLDARIGEGGMATVWRATDLSLTREVAVKILRDDVAAQPDAVSRFRREAHAAAKLNHPNVVQIYDTGVDGTSHYIVMEYLREPDLKRVIKDWAPLPESKVIEVATQCLRALSYAHRNGIVHRDVKPHNILFTDDGRAKLSDFGIAAAVGTGGAGGGFVLGSAHYISPEQAQGSPAGPHSDIYSVGCVMYEALTGVTPFQGHSEAEIAAKHVRERPTSLRSLNPRVSPSTEFVVSKAMAREVARRYRSADEMLADLGKLAGGEDLDRTGVLPPPDTTTVLQPPAAMPEPPSQPVRVGPSVVAREDDIEVSPSRVVREPTAQPSAVAAPAQSATPAEIKGTAWGTVMATVVAVLALIVLIWVGKMLFYPGGADKMVQVPLVKGMTLAEARRSLEAVDLKEGQLKFDQSNLQPEGAVIGQSPEAGQTVRAGTAVDLTVNRGTELVQVISVEGMTMQQAARAIEQAGLTMGEVTQVYHASVPAGSVVKQVPRPGGKVEKGYALDITVSKGPEPRTNSEVPGNGDGTEGTVQAEDPDVTLEQDESYSSSNPAERRFIVTVTAQGQEMNQVIQVVKQDSTGRVAVLTKKLNPSQTQRVAVVTEGTAVIEVVCNDRVVYQETKPMEEGAETGAGGEDNP